MKHKHTPGPWHITQSESNLADADGKIIPLPMRLTASYSAVGDNATRKANAKLIAAAPELLEALIHALPVLSEFSSKVYFEAQDAIKKATE